MSIDASPSNSWIAATALIVALVKRGFRTPAACLILDC
jgi:hypothetical protein